MPHGLARVVYLSRPVRRIRALRRALATAVYGRRSGARAMHALRIVQSRAVVPTLPYAFAVVTGIPRLGRYTSARTGQRVFLRARQDLHVTRELIAGNIYAPPAELAASLRPTKVLDLGANIGLFALSVLHEFDGIAVTAVEPDPANVDVLRRNLAANLYGDGRATVVEAAVGTAAGTAAFSPGRAELSRLAAFAPGQPAITVRTIDFFELVAGHDLVKMDIEGGEWEILADPRMGRVGAVTVLEWHVEGAPSDEPAIAAERLLRAAGYDRFVHLSPTGDAMSAAPALPEAAGGLWAWREPRS